MINRENKNYYSDLLNEIIEQRKLESGSDNLKSKRYKHKNGIIKETYEIENEEQSKLYNKPVGLYEIISIPDTLYLEDKEIDDIINFFAKSLSKLIGKLKSSDKILIIGLGNRHISSDSLGAKVVGKINIVFENNSSPQVMAIAPSVLGLTGIETYDIVSGIVSKTKPTHIILIDSLCASSDSRLGKSLQLSNTGLCPGSGIGNKRKCIDKSLCNVTISIGVPLLIYASTFIVSTFNKFNIGFDKIHSIMQKLKKDNNNQDFVDFVNDINKVYTSRLDDVIVSVKDIEEIVEILSSIIANAINKVMDT